MITIPKSVFEAIVEVGSGVDAKDVPKRNLPYLQWITSRSCMGCGTEATKIDAHHIEVPGISLKCPDEFTVPLCHDRCHLGGVHRGQESFLRSIGLFDHYGHWGLHLAAMNYMAFHILMEDPEWASAPRKGTRSVAYRFKQMAGDSRLQHLLEVYVR